MKMHKVALLKISDNCYYDNYDNYDNYDSYDRVIESVSEWQEVNDEDFKLLIAYSNRTREFDVIEFLPDQAEKIALSVSAQLKHIKILKDKEEKEKAAREKKALDKKHKLAEKNRQEKLKLLQTLKEEFGEV